jgi:hypothetical protein
LRTRLRGRNMLNFKKTCKIRTGLNGKRIQEKSQIPASR